MNPPASRIYKIDIAQGLAWPVPKYDHLTFDEKEELARNQKYSGYTTLIHSVSIEQATEMADWIGSNAIKDKSS